MDPLTAATLALIAVQVLTPLVEQIIHQIQSQQGGTPAPTPFTAEQIAQLESQVLQLHIGIQALKLPVAQS